VGLFIEKAGFSDYTGSGGLCVVVTDLTCSISIPCNVLCTLQVRIYQFICRSDLQQQPASLLSIYCFKFKAQSSVASPLVYKHTAISFSAKSLCASLVSATFLQNQSFQALLLVHKLGAFAIPG
jgi:hypothetical protein